MFLANCPLCKKKVTVGIRQYQGIPHWYCQSHGFFGFVQPNQKNWDTHYDINIHKIIKVENDLWESWKVIGKLAHPLSGIDTQGIEIARIEISPEHPTVTQLNMRLYDNQGRLLVSQFKDYFFAKKLKQAGVIVIGLED
jgi:hypothetical protein